MIGIKGTGMSSLARVFTEMGYSVCGSDVSEHFYTDELLKEIGITPFSGFDPAQIPEQCDAVIFSPAYDKDNNSEVAEALHRSIPMYDFPRALGELTRERACCAVAGTHGKTSVCGMLEYLLASSGTPHAAVYGSSLPTRAAAPEPSRANERTLLIEACEYRNHFLQYHPDCIVLTNVSYDHPDFFHSYREVVHTFAAFVDRLPSGGLLIYCDDDPGAREVQRVTATNRPDIICIPYGERADGPYHVSGLHLTTGISKFLLGEGKQSMHVLLPGTHMVTNTAAALAAAVEFFQLDLDTLTGVLGDFPGCRRRTELIGSRYGMRVIDDYAHHPEEIRAVLDGLRRFYNPQRIVVDFVPHTFSRTETFFDAFCEALDAADLTVIHPVYGTPREGTHHDDDAFKLSKRLAERLQNGQMLLMDQHSIEQIAGMLHTGDLFITMGAGNNRWIGREVLRLYTAQEGD
ncbi:MAG: UDP-N-acetylmuramate--L-alanine ligase [Spirochaetota bacterium]